MGIYIVNCDNSSLDGRYISGNIKAYLKRIKQNLSIDLKTIPIASLLQIDYDEKQICLKDEEKVAQAIKNYLEEDNKPIHEFITSFVNSIAVLEKDLPLLKVKKVLSKVK